MGSSVDPDPDGQPTIGADGDDNDGDGDDEDGVIFPSLPFSAGGTGSLQIIVSGSVDGSNPAYVYGWIDWNQDGDWDDALENVVGQQIATTGTLTFTFPVPNGAKPGNTYARFRIGYNENEVNIVSGEASSGEVEDHLVDPAIRRLPPPPQPAVGGFFIPVNKLTILAPYLLMMISAVLASSILAIRKKYRN